MKAQVGDQLIIESAEPGMPGGAGTIVAVRNADRSQPYLVHWVAGDFVRKIRIVLFGAGAAALRMAVVTSLPDIKRYIRMRQM